MSRTFTREELSEKLANHLKWLRGESGGSRADLSRADLYGANLYGANLSGANLYGADLSGADLSRADLSGANLYCANLYGANLSGANLSGADLYGADLSRANLSGADLSRADLYGANLYCANLSGANLYCANLYGANLSGANLSGADLSGANLFRANLYGANLSGAKDVVFRCAVLPEEGEFICYKKVQNGVVLTLLVPEFAARVTPFCDRKSRVSHATPIRAEKDGKPCGGDVFLSIHDSSFKYTLGQMAEVKDFNGDRREVCTRGIHVYPTKAEARAHQ